MKLIFYTTRSYIDRESKEKWALVVHDDNGEPIGYRQYIKPQVIKAFFGIGEESLPFAGRQFVLTNWPEKYL